MSQSKLHQSKPQQSSSVQPSRKNGRVDAAFIEQLRGFSLTTAEILYRMPDHPSLLQSFVWQDYDLSPQFPKLRGFLEFWSRHLDGPLHRIRVAHAGLIKPAELQFVSGEWRMH